MTHPVLRHVREVVVLRWWSRPTRSRLWDTAVVVALAVSAVPAASRSDGVLGLAAMACVLGFSVLVRRTAPTLAAVGVLGAMGVAVLRSPAVSTEVPLVVVLYSLASARGPRPALVAGGVAVALGAIRLTPLHQNLDPLVYALFVAAVIAAVGLGLFTGSRRTLITQWRQRVTDLELQNDTIARLAVSTERLRLAREMHDTVGHHLTVMVTLAEACKRVLPMGPEHGALESTLDTIADTGRRALGDTRELLGVLRDDGDHDGSGSGDSAAGENLTQVVSTVRSVGLEVTLSGVEALASQRPEHQLVIERAIQEALTNSLKYAGPGTMITIRILENNPGITVTIDDDGRGTRLSGATGSGLGIRGMRERVEALGGSVTAGPLHPRGWQVQLVLP